VRAESDAAQTRSVEVFERPVQQPICSAWRNSGVFQSFGTREKVFFALSHHHNRATRAHTASRATSQDCWVAARSLSTKPRASGRGGFDCGSEGMDQDGNWATQQALRPRRAYSEDAFRLGFNRQQIKAISERTRKHRGSKAFLQKLRAWVSVVAGLKDLTEKLSRGQLASFNELDKTALQKFSEQGATLTSTFGTLASTRVTSRSRRLQELIAATTSGTNRDSSTSGSCGA